MLPDWRALKGGEDEAGKCTGCGLPVEVCGEALCVSLVFWLSVLKVRVGGREGGGEREGGRE